MSMETYADIFISYRRDGGSPYAQLIHDRLALMGYTVHLDVDEGFGAGEFGEKIYRVIDAAKDVVVILSPGALDRCSDEKDWVRQEIAYAIRQHKNLVPVMCPGFSWPTELPDDIQAFSRYNGASYNNEYTKAVFEKLDGILVSEPKRRSFEEAGQTSRPVGTKTELPAQIPDDGLPLEPEVEILKKEPSGSLMFLKRYSAQDVRDITKDTADKLRSCRDEIEEMLGSPEGVPARPAYRAARSAMRIVKEQMGYYTFWPFETDQARLHFEKSYESNVTRIRAAAEQGNVCLTQDLEKTLRQFAKGISEVVSRLTGEGGK